MWFLCGVVCANTQQVKLADFLVELIGIFNAEENASDLHCCTHGNLMGAEQLCVSRMAKATRTGMMLTITIFASFI
jgi:hypothetical protein